MNIAIDIDQMLLSFPKFFAYFVPAMQKAGCKVGILTARSEDQKDTLLKELASMNMKPDFFIGKPDDLKDMPDGIFKAKVCNELEIDVLFDDFECSDPTMLSDFFSTNEKTYPFTSFAYKPDEH